MRVFYAIQFADYVKQALAENLTEIKEYTVRGSFTAQENFHITLVFVGECNANKFELLKKAADNTAEKLNLAGLFKSNPIKAVIDGLGTFPRPFGEELLWVGVKTEPDDILTKINKILIQESANCGIYIKEDHNKFIPHVTLARKLEFSHISGKEVSRLKFSPIDFTINSITLMESVQETVQNRDRRYTKLVYKPLYVKNF